MNIFFHLLQVDSTEAVSQVLSGVKPQAKKAEKKTEKPKSDKEKKGVMFSLGCYWYESVSLC